MPLRQQMKQQRKALSQLERAQFAQLLTANALRSQCFRAPMKIGSYVAIGCEAEPSGLNQILLARGCKLFLPACVDEQNMVFRAYSGATLSHVDAQKIPAPDAGQAVIPINMLDVLIMPLVAFDDTGTRLGSGKGFYDRALADVGTAKKPLRLGFAFELQRCNALKREPWDVPLHAVVTEQRYRIFGVA